MTFLSPSSLFLLFAITIPIVIHLLNRFNVKNVEFSTIRFLKSLENNAIKNIKLKKMLLLLLRIGIITCLVLMIARPVTKGFMPGWISAELESRLLLVVDNSSSMSGKVNKETLLDVAKRAAKDLYQIYNENTTIDIVQTCPPKTLYSGKVTDLSIPSIIDQINQTVNYDNIWTLLDSLTKTLQATEPIKECVIISDFQNNTIPDNRLSDNWKFYLVNAGIVNNNLSINNLEVISSIKVPDQLLKLKTSIKNTGNTKLTNSPINLFFENNRVGQVISEFDKGSNKEFIFQAYPDKKGVLNGSVKLPNDDYLMDNIWYMTIPILDKINCLMIGSSDEEIKMFKLIVDAIDPDKQLIDFDSKKLPVVNRLFIDDIDILIIHNPEAFTESAFDELDIYLQEGGGLIWFSGGMEVDPAYNKYFSNFNFPNALNLVESESGLFNVNLPQREDHLLSNISVRKLKNELPECYRYIKHSHNNKHNIHLELNNGDPLLLDFNRGNGKIFYFTSLMNLSWSDIPLRGIMVPLMYRLLMLGGTDEINTVPVAVGDVKWISLGRNEVRNKWEVKAPSGEMTLVVPDFSKESLKILNTNELGIYEIYQNGNYYTAFSTYLHTNEIIYKQVTKNQIAGLFSKEMYRWVNIDKNFNNVFNEIRQGKSLWKIFLLIALIFFLLETWIGRPISKNIKH